VSTVADYPRPLLRRAEWFSLDGSWQFHLDPEAQLRRPAQVQWESLIQVPFAPETPASGIDHAGFFRACWYRRTFNAPEIIGDQRLILHFGAVDYNASVWFNDHLVVQHEGGYTPFSTDVTEFLLEGGSQTIVVRAEDDPARPR
jgi:beta-galactosidase/beta-glucuronidase